MGGGGGFGGIWRMAVFVAIEHKININSVVTQYKTKSAKSYFVIGVTPKMHNGSGSSNTWPVLQTLHTLSPMTAQGRWHYPHVEVRKPGFRTIKYLV